MDFKIEKAFFLRPLKLFYLFLSLILIYAEYLKDADFLYVVKPLLMPTLFFLYFVSTDRKGMNLYFVIALFFMWIANICFISTEKEIFLLGILTTFISRLFVLILILKCCKCPKPLPFLIGTFPFAIIFITVLELLNNSLGDAFYFVVLNGVLVILLGGISLANYIMSPSKINTYILISIIMFVFMRFIVAIDHYYLSVQIFRPIAIVIFSAAQYILYMAVIAMNQAQTEKIKP
ncbi:hypothetical protein FSS13T_13750 [Flavobacterium saliperosum S13]|uniref:YhhN-like protein n=2 Tax=Flavobacterium saliperosum TaxID=329186 RepID=A0A1G4VE28_9FLAO|nr:lysoplasmalogenase family protein [Flavobacterium saliperosum]ESU25908.1 hypothetical protein FSS13T_13750 [Flavobacterium saliperosum S13]SCX05378.1 YhhN-like protein [Flavobacterium saliperosum]